MTQRSTLDRAKVSGPARDTSSRRVNGYVASSADGGESHSSPRLTSTK
jgi:hypothetical protein